MTTMTLILSVRERMQCSGERLCVCIVVIFRRIIFASPRPLPFSSPP
jgi:hypothetical protein